MNKQKLIYTKGLPGCGKSTLVKKMVQESGGQLKRINKDDLRAMIDPKWSNHKEKFVVGIRNAFIHDALDKGYSVVVDDTNLSGGHIETFKSIAESKGVELEEIDLTHVSPLVCIERDLARERTVGHEVIWNMYNNFIAKKHKFDESLKNCIIVDLDGTYCLYDRNKGGHYDRDFINDTCNRFVDDIVKREVNDGAKLVIFSGRDSNHEVETRDWLNKYKIYPDVFAMRIHGDSRADFDVKKEMFENHIENVFNVEFVIDDRPQVIRLWKSMGLPVIDVGFGNYF